MSEPTAEYNLAQLGHALDAAWVTFSEILNAYAIAGGGGYSAVMLKDGEPAEVMRRLPKRSPLRPRFKDAEVKAEARAKGYAIRTLQLTVPADEPVPDCGPAYPATEPDEDAAYEYAEEAAPLTQEDRR